MKRRTATHTLLLTITVYWSAQSFGVFTLEVHNMSKCLFLLLDEVQYSVRTEIVIIVKFLKQEVVAFSLVRGLVDFMWEQLLIIVMQVSQIKMLRLPEVDL